DTRSRESRAANLAALKDGLDTLGWKEGSDVVFVEHWANGRPDTLPALAEALKASKPAVIVTGALVATVAAAKGVPNTPIVQATGSSPVSAGLAANLARPGGMVTGVTNLATDVSEKNIELLLAAVPKLRRIGFLVDTTLPNRLEYLEMARRSGAKHV